MCSFCLMTRMSYVKKIKPLINYRSRRERKLIFRYMFTLRVSNTAVVVLRCNLTITLYFVWSKNEKTSQDKLYSGDCGMAFDFASQWKFSYFKSNCFYSETLESVHISDQQNILNWLRLSAYDFKFGRNIFCTQIVIEGGPNWSEPKPAAKCNLNAIPFS